MLVAGVAGTLFETLFTTELQRQIPQDRLSRVMAYDMLASFAFIPLGAPAVGALASSLGTTTALWIAAAVVLTASLGPLLLSDIRSPVSEDETVDVAPAVAY
jgi:hypothetical protein